MIIQRKLLNIKQKSDICWLMDDCKDCPLSKMILGYRMCYTYVEKLRKELDKYWEEEIEVDL